MRNLGKGADAGCFIGKERWAPARLETRAVWQNPAVFRFILAGFAVSVEN
ncbi:MAG: hypothetical protein ACUVSP_10560 [Desulfotomaculales bacterium]